MKYKNVNEKMVKDHTVQTPTWSTLETVIGHQRPSN